MDYQNKTAGELIEAAVEACKETVDTELPRPFASAYEVWAKLKDVMEQAKKQGNDAEKLHKEIWTAVKEKNDDELSIELREMGRYARSLAFLWAAVAADAERGANEV